MKRTHTIVTTILILCVYCLSFMILDRILSLVYGFNFQPYGEFAPKGFPIWGHFFNGGAAALGAFCTFWCYDWGKKKNKPIIQIGAILFILTVGAIIPYLNDYEHLAKNGKENTLLIYLIFNDLYVFTWGFLMYIVAKSKLAKLYVLISLIAIFLFIHFVLYLPQFPDFYWI